MRRRGVRTTSAALAGLLLVLGAAGCGPGSAFWLVYPEQRHLGVRAPGQVHGPPLPAVPPPATVAEPAPAGAPKELSLDEAIHIALANSKVVRVLAGVTATASGQTIYDAAITNTTVDEARSVFDPAFSVRQSWSRLNEPFGVLNPFDPTGAQITSTPTDLSSLSVGLTKKTVTGGTFNLDLESATSRFGNGVFPLNPQTQSSLTLNYTQPLLRGAGVAANVAPIVVARLNTEVSFFQYKDSVQELVRGVVEAYWAVVFARTDVWAKKQQVEQGEAAYERAAARQRSGFGNAAEVAQTKTSLYNFKANLVGAEANLLQREAALRNLLGLPPTDPPRLTPTTPAQTARVEPCWEALVKLAGANRPDLVELKLIIEADQQNRVLANNQARPQVDLVTYYRWNGLEGETPAGTHASAGSQYADWSVGVNFSVPLGLRGDRARLRRSELVLARDHANLEQGLHSALHALAGSVRNLAQFYEQYQAYKQTRSAARQNLEQQLADFRAGRAIYLNVLQAISDWGNAVSAEAQALASYNTELANLERQSGTILETHGVRFSEERYRAIGPLGRCAPPVCYPAASPPTPNLPHYPTGTEPAEKALEAERPTLPPAAPTETMPRPKMLPPTGLR